MFDDVVLFCVVEYCVEFIRVMRGFYYRSSSFRYGRRVEFFIIV